MAQGYTLLFISCTLMALGSGTPPKSLIFPFDYYQYASDQWVFPCVPWFSNLSPVMLELEAFSPFCKGGLLFSKDTWGIRGHAALTHLTFQSQT